MIIPVNADTLSYDIILERGALKRAGELLDLNRRVLIVTDSGVPKEYAETVAAQCREPVILTIPQGEASKNFDTFKELLSTMLSASFTRKDAVAAVGGGVVGDLSGFAASCYMRGIDFYNIPTTLLSEVDSSIGGKTAIDFEGVKNIVGSFYQPKRVIIDPDTLKTLSTRELHAGLAESIKMAANFDADLFELIECSTDLSSDLEVIIEKSLRIKGDVVEKDTKEAGLRKVLNFGHTLGHAVEADSDGALLHGECVALGMLPMSSESVRERIEKVLEKYELPTRILQSPDKLMPYVLHDKKVAGSKVAAVYCNEIGSFELRDTDPAELMERLSVLNR